MMTERVGDERQAALQARVRRTLIGLALVHVGAGVAAVVLGMPLLQHGWRGGTATTLWLGLAALGWVVFVAGAVLVAGRRLSPVWAVVVYVAAYAGFGYLAPGLSRWFQQTRERQAWPAAESAATLEELERVYGDVVPAPFWREGYAARRAELQVGLAAERGDVARLRALRASASGDVRARVDDALRELYAAAAERDGATLEGGKALPVDDGWRAGWQAMLASLATAGEVERERERAPVLEVAFVERFDTALGVEARAALRVLREGDGIDAATEELPIGEAFSDAEAGWRQALWVATLRRSIEGVLGEDFVELRRVAPDAEQRSWRLLVDVEVARGDAWHGVPWGEARAYLGTLRCRWRARLLAPDGAAKATLGWVDVDWDRTSQALMLDVASDPSWAAYAVQLLAAGDRFRRRVVGQAGYEAGPPLATYAFRPAG